MSPNHKAIFSAFLFVGLFVWFGFSKTAAAGPTFQEANALYKEGKYGEAAEAYEAILKSNPSPEVYYNLGNAYFKNKKIGLAILNYERARLISPRDRDILSNLAYMNRLLEYKVEDKRNWYVRKTAAILEYVTSAECWMAGLGAYFIFIAGVLISILLGKKPIFGSGSTLIISFVFLCCVPLFLKLSPLGARHKAVVTALKADVRYGPFESDRLAFRLMEGLKVTVRDERDNWYRIELTDGRSGWVPRTQMTSV